jgi:hypothetical protein
LHTFHIVDIRPRSLLYSRHFLLEDERPSSDWYPHSQSQKNAHRQGPRHYLPHFVHLTYCYPLHIRNTQPGATSTRNSHFIGSSSVLAWQITRTSLPDSPYLVGSSPVVAWYYLRTRLEATPYLLGKYPVPRWHQIAFIYPVIRRLQKTNVL